MSKFNFSVDVQHFDAQNSIRCEKKHAVYNYSEHVQYCETFLRNERTKSISISSLVKSIPLHKTR